MSRDTTGPAPPLSETWLWYAVKTAGLVELDTSVYPCVRLLSEDPILGWNEPKPDWACQAPNGGVHIRASARRIDVHIAKRPISRVELNCIVGYSLILIATSWLDLISDLIDPDRVFVGDVILRGENLPDWRTIRSLAQPLVRSRNEATFTKCPNCGDEEFIPRSPPYYFDDQKITGEAVLADNARSFG